MKALFKLFSRKKSENIKLKNTQDYITINNKMWRVSDIIPIKVQTYSDNKQVYGWSLECKVENTNWFNWKNKIYGSINSATSACININKSYGNNYEFRVVALYKMTEPEFRDYKIEQLIGDTERIKFKKLEIKAWKVKEDCEIFYERTNKRFEYKKGTLFIEDEQGRTLTIKNQTTKLGLNDGYMLRNDLIVKGLVEQVNIENEKWAMPHLCKELKQKIKK
jgi:hypothetical protein